ncbi:MAG: DegT/DnrJ/EryC1/StrS family aminotransferase [Lachnospiraceae bacterium]|nr:DegT/DnrJ/EryC1/StrS family aminotransferase [Lachnospiraceae bacterium]
MKISFSPPDISEKEIIYVSEALRSGWITTGPRVKQLEENLAEFIGMKKTACLNSQTASAEMALRLLGIGPGDEVITCAYTYTASASVIDHVGATIKLVDCQKDSLEMDYAAMADAITEKTKAIIPVDLAGVPCDYDRIFQIVNEKKDLFVPRDTDNLAGRLQRSLGRVAVLADAAHALGASYKGRNVGTIADFTSFSFHAVKNLTTGEGGCLCWTAFDGVEDEEIYHQIQLFSLHGQSKDAFAKNKPGTWEYDVEGLWYKSNMTDIMAAIGLAQLERYPELLKKRRAIIEKYNAAFRPLGIEVLPHYTEKHNSSGHLYLTRIPFGKIQTERSGDPRRNEIITKMAEAGIACNVHYKPLPLLSGYQKLGFDITDYPNAYECYSNEVTLPLHTRLTVEEIDYIIEQFTKITRDYIS